MDRLSAVALALVAVAACDSGKDAGPPPSRTDGAKVAKPQAATTEAFCDLHATDATGPAFTWPELADGTAPPPAAGRRWRWINVWATWCKPCVEEMPRLQKWRGKLGVDLAFISIDEDAADVTAFKAAHPESPPTLRFATKDKGTAWLHGFQLDTAAIPIHVFVSPAGKIRCARAGGVREQDYDTVAKLLAE